VAKPLHIAASLRVVSKHLHVQKVSIKAARDAIQRAAKPPAHGPLVEELEQVTGNVDRRAGRAHKVAAEGMSDEGKPDGCPRARGGLWLPQRPQRRAPRREPYPGSDFFDDETARRSTEAWWKGWDRGTAELDRRRPWKG
jgi:hypothetical protein